MKYGRTSGIAAGNLLILLTGLTWKFTQAAVRSTRSRIKSAHHGGLSSYPGKNPRAWNTTSGIACQPTPNSLLAVTRWMSTRTAVRNTRTTAGRPSILSP